VSEQHEEEILRRWAREQAEIERQTDALVLKALTAMVTAAEDLKSKLRRDVEGILEEYRRSKRGLENEISLATAERARFRREVEQERDSIISQAESKAREIVTHAEREREALLGEARDMEQRLRTLDEQIRSVFAIELAPTKPEAAESAPDAAAPAETTEPEPTGAGGFMPASVSALTSRPGPSVGAPVQTTPVADDDAELAAAEPAARSRPAAPAAPFADDDDDESPGVSAVPAASASAPSRAPQPAARPSGPRQVELVFDGVPGYQQASALEMAVGDLLPDVEVDIVEFERGQLVLSAETGDLDTLAQQLVVSMPASLRLTTVSGDRATFHCV
jgi:cell division septum initiation protein DivIVA